MRPARGTLRRDENDAPKWGLPQALKAANGISIVIGINGILPAIKLVETGAMLATVDFDMFKIGWTATRCGAPPEGRALPEKIMLLAEFIDRTNYKAWLVPAEQRTCPEWAEVIR